jgi:hypothetical protein
LAQSFWYREQSAQTNGGGPTADDHVGNGGNSPVGHVANGRNPFGPEDGDNKPKLKGKANISLPLAFYELLLRDSVTRFFASGSFHEPVSPQPQSIPLGPLQIFSKIRGDIRKSRCTTGINDTGGK